MNDIFGVLINKTLKQFAEASSEASEKMIKLAGTMNRLTKALLFLTIVLTILTLFQIVPTIIGWFQ